MNDGDPPVFRSRRDLWLSLTVWLAVLMCAGASGAVIAGGSLLILNIAAAIVSVGAAGLMLWVLYGTSYTIAGRLLRIRSGPYRVSIPLSEVTGVQRRRSFAAGPACSLDRVHILYRDRSVAVSPRDEAAFLKALLPKQQAAGQ